MTTTPAPWLHEFGVARLEEHLSREDETPGRDVVCPRCRLFYNSALPECPSCAN